MKELDPNKPVQLRDGRQVRNICWDYKLSNRSVGISAIVRTNDNEHDFYQLWYSNGIAYQGTSDSSNDLINVPERIEGWIHIYQNGSVSMLHNSKKIIDQERNTEIKYGCPPPIACIHVSFTVGEGVE